MSCIRQSCFDQHTFQVSVYDEWAFDIPIAERIHEKVVEFDAEAIAKLQERVPMWREYLNTLAV